MLEVTSASLSSELDAANIVLSENQVFLELTVGNSISELNTIKAVLTCDIFIRLPCDDVLRLTMEYLFDEYNEKLISLLRELSPTASRTVSLVRFPISLLNWVRYRRDHPDWKTTSPRIIFDLFRLSDLSTMPYVTSIEFVEVFN